MALAIISFPVGVKSIVISVSMCLSVCLSVRPVTYLKNHTSKFHQIFCTCYLRLWVGLSLTAVRHVAASGGGRSLPSPTASAFIVHRHSRAVQSAIVI